MDIFLQKVKVLQKQYSGGEETSAQVLPENFVNFLERLILRTSLFDSLLVW